MKIRFIIIGIIIFVAIYLPIHYTFLGIDTTTKTYLFCEDGFIQSENKCVPDPKISKEIAVDQENLKIEST
ncbi:MAG: hypothetical protein ACKVN8_00845 [Nitrosarchaeum sp.]